MDKFKSGEVIVAPKLLLRDRTRNKDVTVCAPCYADRKEPWWPPDWKAERISCKCDEGDISQVDFEVYIPDDEGIQAGIEAVGIIGNCLESGRLFAIP